MIEVEGPGGVVVEFPDGTPREVMSSAMQKKFGGGGQDRPWYSKFGSAADDMARIAANGMTFGYADKLAGWAGREGTEAERAKTEAARSRAGSAGVAADLGGGLATGMGLSGAGLTAAKLVPQGLKGLTGLGARTAAMGAEGAAYGAANALGNDQDVGTGAMLGAGAGVAGNLVGEGASKLVGKVAGAFNKQPELPDAAAIRAAKDAAYKASDEAGVILRPEVVQGIRGKIQDDLANFGYLPANQPKVKAVLDELDRVAGDNITLKGLDQVRKQAGGAYDPTNKTSNSITSKIIQRIDEGVSKVAPESVLTGDAAAGVGNLTEARRLNSQVSRLDRVTEALTKADRNAASSGSGGNTDNAVRQQIKAILNSASRSRGFSPDERAAMETVVRGTDGQNLARKLGRLSPNGNGLMASLYGMAGGGGLGAAALGAGAATGGAGLAAAAIPATVGMIAKPIAENATKNNVNELVRIIQAGGNRSDAFAAPNAVQRLAETKRDALIRALMMGGIVATPRTAQ